MAILLTESIFEEYLSKGKELRFSVDEVDVTPEMASYILSQTNKHNRKPSPAAIRRHMRTMKAGRWGTCSSAISLTSGGILSNGQHRLLAVVGSGTTQKFDFRFGVSPDEFQNEDVDAYARSTSAVLTLTSEDEGMKIRYPQIRTALCKLLLKLSGVEDFSNHEVVEMARDMIDNQDAHIEDALTLGVRMNGITRPTGAVLAFYTLLKTNKASMVHSFAEGLKEGVGLDKFRAALRNGLLERAYDQSDREWENNITAAGAIINCFYAKMRNKGGKVSQESFVWKYVAKLPTGDK